MEPGASQIIQEIAGLLIPPACREEVLGDLCERCLSTGQFIAEGMRTIPFVVLSRIRRTADPVVLLMQALPLFSSFVITAWWLAPAMLTDSTGFLLLAIPGAITLAAIMLGDAYANPRTRSPLKPILGAALGIAGAFAVQLILESLDGTLALPRVVMVAGAGASLLLICSLRLLFPPIEDLPQGISGPAFWQKRQLTPLGIKRWQVVIPVLALMLAYALFQSRG